MLMSSQGQENVITTIINQINWFKINAETCTINKLAIVKSEDRHQSKIV